MRRELSARSGVALMAWLTLVLWLDRSDGGGGLVLQRGLGGLTWLLLLGVLARAEPAVRAQTAVVVAVATTVEYLASPLLQVYTYRFDNVPAFVPPGHGLVYLSALALGQAGPVRRHPRRALAGVLGVGGAWAAHGLLVADRPDVLGAFWFGCLVVFCLVGPSRAVYVGAFVAVGWLEVAGTHLGTWEWARLDPTGWVSIGNPPSGAAGGYAWFDLAGLGAAPWLLRAWSRARARVSARRPTARVVDGAR